MSAWSSVLGNIWRGGREGRREGGKKGRREEGRKEEGGHI